ncbi:hypothetical protein K492DRAFT_177236 [Lichtheimia hyalospora FSU 10163]|nr:hypothetical protein K492DRAFT_177236 [Lichtheimia hyalospora FSU 10163]
MNLHEEWLAHWKSQKKKCLHLRNSDMEQICRELTTQRDVYELCLMHPMWQKAATDVLWEAPQFQTLGSFERFAKSACQHKRLAIVVKRLSLMLRDQQVDTIFVPHVYSELAHHQPCDHQFTQTDLIQHLIQQCERIQELRVYGWFLDRFDLGSLGSRLQELQDLTLVGCSSDIASLGVIQRSLLSKLRRLCLDGPFILSKSFVTTLENRALSLQALQIPLPCNRDHMISPGNMSSDDPYARATYALIRSLARAQLELRSLTLTHALYLNHDHVRALTQNFPDLEELVIDGVLGNSTHMVIMALTHSLGLKRLDIRAHKQNMQNDPYEDDESIYFPHGPLVLEKLLLENVDINDKQLIKVTDEAHEIKVLGLSHCSWVTSLGVIHLIDHNPSLHTLHLIHCRNISDSFFKYLGDMNTSAVIHDIYVEHCGSLHPRVFHQICRRGVSYGLRRIKIVGYDNIVRAVIGRYAAVDHDTNSITLDQQAIRRIAELDILDLTPTLQNYYLTSEHIVLLSKELELSVTHLVETIERVQQCDNDSLQQQHNKESLTTSSSYGESHPYNTQSEELSLTEQRSTTPFLWECVRKTSTKPFTQKPILQSCFEEEASLDDDQSDTTTPLSKPSAYDRVESTTSTQSIAIGNFQQNDEPVERDGPCHSDETRFDFNSSTGDYDMDLGGWGTVSSWNDTPSKSKTSATSSTHMHQHTQEGWGVEGVTEWNHVKQQRQRQQESATVNRPTTPSRDTDHADVEGWGTPNNVMEWKDLRKQGYAHQVIEDQVKSFSNNNSNHWSTPASRTPSPQKEDNNTSLLKAPFRLQLSPDDELIDWDDDDGVTIITDAHTSTRMTTARTQSPVTGRIKGNSWMVCTPMLPPPNHPGNPKWSTGHEWMNKSQESVIMIENDHPVPLQDNDDDGWFAGWSVVKTAELLCVPKERKQMGERGIFTLNLV